MNECLTKMKMFVDYLGTVGYLIIDEDLMLHVLADLGSEYDLAVVNLTFRIVLAIWQEAQVLLLNQESCIDQMNDTTTLDLSNAFANYVFNKKLGSNNGQNTIERGRVGHIALRCYCCFDHHFQAPQNNQASTLIATPELVSDQSWYDDSGATNHVIAELGNLLMKSNYHGEDKLVVDNVSPDVLHRRLGHPCSSVMSHVHESCNPNASINGKLNFCDACQFGKIHALPYKSSSSQTSSHLELIHTDIWGSTLIVSNSGYKYYIHFIDDFSRYTWVHPLQTRAECHKMLQMTLPMGLYRG
ncbi:hypothetical protein AAG906_040777 [Vitis piasezkii]